MGESKFNVLVVGDIMIDRYTYVATMRQAPEAPIPVWDRVAHENRLGGAANVAHNLKALGGDEVEVMLAGIVSPSDKQMIGRLGLDTLLCAGFESMYKDRYIESGSMKHLFRCDNMQSFSDSGINSFRKCCEHFLRGHVFDAVIFSDYNKGTIDETVVELASKTTGTVVVDSKRIDLSMFRGSQILKINEHEYSVQVSRAPYPFVERLFGHVVVTKGARGAELRHAVSQVTDQRIDNQPKIIEASSTTSIISSEEFPTISVKARDVTGCGDTHTAAMTFSLLKNKDVRSAVKFANLCARNVVQQFGTSVVQNGGGTPSSHPVV